jgi:hypothetical protein
MSGEGPWDDDTSQTHGKAYPPRRPHAPISLPPTPQPEIRYIKAPSPWPAAAQNIVALLVTGTLTQTGHITGNVGAGMILTILGVIAVPAILKKGAPGSIGVLALLWKPLAAVFSSGTIHWH